jgi:hypothetical protein
MSNNMADETKQEELETSTDSSTETSEQKETKDEPKVPLARLRKETEKVKKLESEIREKEAKASKDEGRAEEDSGFSEKMARYEAEKARKEKEALDKFNAKIEELKVIEPSLNEEQLSDIIEKYGVDLEKGFKIYQDLKSGQAPKIKPKMPSGPKTKDEVQKEEFEPAKVKSTWDAMKEGLKKHGLG